MSMRPVLYSFRRCPYAIRARLALLSAGQETELREIVLKDKASEFVQVSPKATVPVLVVGEVVLEESLDIMRWALNQNDPEGWLDMPQLGQTLIDENDSDFKAALDRTKYNNRYDSDPEVERTKAGKFLQRIASVSSDSAYLFSDRPSLADIAVLPFIRQFANIDRDRFNAEAPPWCIGWLDRFLHSSRLKQVMEKYTRWEAGQPTTVFPSFSGRAGA